MKSKNADACLKPFEGPKSRALNQPLLSKIAMFMIALILSIPFYSAAAFAGLSNAAIRSPNSDDPPNYIRKTGTNTISVDAYIEGAAEIDPSQVRLTQKEGSPFEDCQLGLNGKKWRCTYPIESSSLPNGDFQRMVFLLNKSGSDEGSIRIKGIKDAVGPEITSFTASQATIGKGTITFNYDITDYMSEADSSNCIGLKDIIFTAGAYTNPIEINSQSGECTYSDTFTEDIEKITKQSSGNITIRAIAHDNFNQQSKIKELSLKIDRQQPQIKEGTFRLLDDNNKDIRFASGTQAAKASIEVADTDLALVKADFTSLSPRNYVMDAECQQGVCTWSGISVSKGGTHQVKITAQDSLGNEQPATILYQIDIDDQKPDVKGLKSNHQDSEGKNYLGKADNQLIYQIEETGVGFGKRNIYLDLRNLGLGENVQAGNCTKTDSSWSCYWKLPALSASDGAKQIFIRPHSTDDLGNEITGILENEIIVDTIAPKIGTIESSKEAVRGQPLIFTFTASDQNPLIVYANTSKISAVALHTGTCQESCRIEITDLVPSYTVQEIPITAQDVAGNQAEKKSRITILQADANTTPSFYRIERIEVIPPKVDKQVISQIPVNIFVHAELEGIGSAEIISKTVVCPAMADYLAGTSIIGEEDTYIGLKLNQRAATLPSVPIACSLRLLVKDNKNVYSKYEEENITAQLELYGNSLGDLTETTKSKLDSINQEISNTEDAIKSYEKWIKTWGIWCQISEGLGFYSSLVQTIKSAIWMVLAAKWAACAAGLGSCTKAVDKVWGVKCTSASLPHAHVIEKWIWPSGPIGFPVGMVNKWACSIGFHCAVCNWNTWYDLGVSLVVHTAAKKVGTYDDGKTVREMDRVTVDVEGVNDRGTVESIEGDNMVIKLDNGHTVTKPASQVARVGIDDNVDISINRPDGSVEKIQAKVRDVDLSSGEVTTTQGSYSLTDVQLSDSVEQKPNQIIGRPGEKVSVASSQNKRPSQEGITTDWSIPKKTNQINSPVNAPKGKVEFKNYKTIEDTDSIIIFPGETQARYASTGQAYTYTGKDDKGNEIWQRTYSNYEEQGQLTSVTPSSNWIFDPYKSIHYAKACLCLPAIVYNLKKEKQIQCMQRNCISNHIQKGLPATECDAAYKERQCLYVEGAEYKKHGYGAIAGSLWTFVKNNLPYLAASIGYLATCWDYIISPEGICSTALVVGTPAGGIKPTACGLIGSSMTLMEMASTIQSGFSFLNYDQDLKGEDYCATGNYQ
ncbi:MAG TPA: hypothetical protein VFF28_06870 [Candidatus Nanoarchaeia archaeon]|nr:hypothetical protein [Candidatus Nanoarchaeia archaeon]